VRVANKTGQKASHKWNRFTRSRFMYEIQCVPALYRLQEASQEKQAVTEVGNLVGKARLACMR